MKLLAKFHDIGKLGIPDLIYYHHERWDGNGYPEGIVDTFDAMTNDRPYRKALSVEVARDEITRFSGSQFDPELAKVFLSLIAK